ncbi:radical SAM family heme chaperone HemW [Roseovarius sp. LXJ103]|uniref:radical SAM family heme chaperone HemW n=1 Tax=Roseovarius carneus TaxID=2853164 RepID=UPI000D6172B8|nr:radical SAM family heme chaperone HemW [Roseovarius carneus]MBZ8117914.1 radical SAM family heme chaperone HemW [Roseovarius carneus]PWE36331.1 coproporphyrinogen III oxidase [Pelagicola sp. LXJ1103]
MTEDWRHGGFGLYIHWPYCEAKCPYCDFNSHVSQTIDQSAWADAYLRELDRTAALTPGRVLNSVFFGGGTPSLMNPDTVARIMERIGQHWTLANDFEATLEANPSSVEASRFRAYAEAGVNRVSMGIQALNDADLKRLGRLHSAAEARAAFDIARACFDRVSFDLIYARQDQTLEQWQSELGEALTMAIDHLSLYQLTIEPGTAFGARDKIGKLRGLPTEDLGVDMYELTQELCEAAGMPAYEVSNHAQIGSESRHNLIYWRHGDYLGIGPGAHGRLTLNGKRFATEAYMLPDIWLRRAQIGTTEKPHEQISAEDQASELLIMGLRLSEGVDLERLGALSPMSLNQERLANLIDLGLVETEGRQLRATPSGRIILNSVIAELLAP